MVGQRILFMASHSHHEIPSGLEQGPLDILCEATQGDPCQEKRCFLSEGRDRYDAGSQCGFVRRSQETTV
jgi:hypothetical protein